MNYILPIPPTHPAFFIYYVLIFILLLAFAILVYFIFTSSHALASLIVDIFLKVKVNANSPEKKTNLDDAAYTRALQILDNARDKSLKIYTESQLRAQKTLDQAIGLSEEKRQELKNRLEEMYHQQENLLKQFNHEIASEYKKALDKQKDESIQSLITATNDIKKEVLSDMEEFKNVVKRETVDSKREIEEKIKTSYEALEKDISVYKEKRIAELNQRIVQVISNVSEKVLGKTIDQTTHEKYILDTLDQEIRKYGLDYDGKSTDKN